MNLNLKKYLIFDFDGTIDDLIINWKDIRKGYLKIAHELEPTSVYHSEQVSYQMQVDLINKYGNIANQKFIELSREYEKK